MPWLAGVIGGIAQYAGQRQAANSQNNWAKQMYQPGLAQGWNPWLFSALGQNVMGSHDPSSSRYVDRQSGYYQDLQKLVNGQDISPYLLNQPLNQINQGANQNMAKFQSMVGRSGMTGGLANAYALSNLGQRNTSIANLYNQYGQWKEQQRRNDIWNIMGQMGQAQDRARGAASGQAQMYQQPMNFMQGLGNGIAGGLAAYGSMGGSTSAPQAQTYSGITTPGASSPYVNSLGSQGNWFQYK